MNNEVSDGGRDVFLRQPAHQTIISMGDWCAAYKENELDRFFRELKSISLLAALLQAEVRFCWSCSWMLASLETFYILRKRRNYQGKKRGRKVISTERARERWGRSEVNTEDEKEGDKRVKESREWATRPRNNTHYFADPHSPLFIMSIHLHLPTFLPSYLLPPSLINNL